MRLYFLALCADFSAPKRDFRAFLIPKRTKRAKYLAGNSAHKTKVLTGHNRVHKTAVVIGEEHARLARSVTHL